MKIKEAFESQIEAQAQKLAIIEPDIPSFEEDSNTDVSEELKL